MGILTKLKELFAKGPIKIIKPKKQDQPELHHHNHGSSTT
jgi:hypothetical protein